MGSSLPELKEHVPLKLRHSQKHTTPLCVYGVCWWTRNQKNVGGSSTLTHHYLPNSIEIGRT